MDANRATDLQERVDANLAEGDLPTAWTPEHVRKRLIAAFDVLRRSVGRVGPHEFTSPWPEVYADFKDLLDPQAYRNHQIRFWSGSTTRPSAHDIALMEEALRWPLEFLRDYPKEADALTLFCVARSEDGIIAARLRERVEAAKRRIPVVIADNRRRRAALARDVAAWANGRLASMTERERAVRHDIIRHNAAIRLERAIAAAGGLRLDLRPHDVMPGRVLTREPLDRYRKRGEARISAALHLRDVPVR